MKTEVAVSKVPKTEKEKSGGLEGYDLNNYASKFCGIFHVHLFVTLFNII